MTRRQASLAAALIISAIITLVLLLFPQLQTAPTQQATPLGFYKVTAVADGDTITVDMNGTPERIRMIGVDTPETHDPGTPVQCYGPEASAFTKQALLQKAVRLEADPTNDNRDRYDRLLRYVYLEDGSLFSETLIRQGYGFAYLSFPFQKSQDFAAHQTEAQTAKRGLWSACQPTNSNGRWQTNNAQ